MSRILVLGAGRGQVDLIKTAKRMGHEVLVATHADHYPGVPLADKICYVDIANAQNVLQIAQNEQIEAIVTACLDTGIEALGYTCEKMNLPGLSYDAAKRANDKLLMKDALIANQVSTAEYRKVTCAEDLEIIINTMPFPLIIKAVDLQGSRGIYICQTEEELRDNYRSVQIQTKKDYCIVEEFIVGREFGAEAFVCNGEILFVLPHGKNNYMSATGVPIGHFAPLDRDDAFLKQCEEVVSAAIEALRLDNCAVNVDLIERDGQIYIIELTGRVGANCLPELVSLYYGVDYYEMIVACAAGGDPAKIFNNRSGQGVANASRMITLEKTGILKKIENKNVSDDPRVYNITFFVNAGDEVRKFTNSNDCVAQVVVTGQSYDDCDRKIKEVIRNIEFVIE